MSRVGKQPVAIPQGVKALYANGVVNIEGPKGKLSFRPAKGVAITTADGKIVVSASTEDKQTKANYGTARATINNMVQGVTQGWKRSLEMSGVGFGAKVQGSTLVLSVGFSHDVNIVLPAGVKCAVNKTTIDLESTDLQVLGLVAAKIRKVQPPEPYLGKGIRYSDEIIRRKAGKTGKK